MKSEGELMAQDDRCWDGMWMADGYDGMFMFLVQDGFDDNEYEDFLGGKEELGDDSVENDFLMIPSEEDGWVTIYERILHPRNLQVASGIIHLFTQGACPPRIRISHLEDYELKEMIEQKLLGNEAFSKERDYEKALLHYEDALLLVDNMFVAPASQMSEVIKILSNQAECYLRLKKYKDAGKAATDALMFDSDHVKSRLRRAKAELAIGGVPYLIQAQVDLNNILEKDKEERIGTEEAKEYMTKVNVLLKKERHKWERENPNNDWGLSVRMIKSKCCW